MAFTNLWQWSPTDVSQFFRQTIPLLAAQIPTAGAPDVEHLARCLFEHDVSGRVLLNLTTEFLRGECGIVSFGRRDMVLAVVRILRKHAESEEDPYRDIASSLVLEQAETISRPLGVLAERPASSEPIMPEGPRRDETIIKDTTGRKRRKLVLTQPLPLQPVDKVELTHSPQVSSTYLPHKKVAIDDVIYGTANLDGSIPEKLAGDMTQADDTLCFLSSREPKQGETKFVYSQMRHLFRSSARRSVRYKGRATESWFPYRADILPNGVSQSLTLFPGTDMDQPAVRINVAMLDDDDDQKVVPSAGTGEWDFLIDKYQTPVDHTLPTLHASDSMTSISTAFAQELEDEENELTKAAKLKLSREEAENVLEETIEDYAVAWQEAKAPKLEEREAHKTWRRMTNSRRMRDLLIKQSNEEIGRLRSRLQKYKSDLLEQEWKTSKELRKQCSILLPTIEDVERCLWNIAVWKRKEVPHHQEPRKMTVLKLVTEPDGRHNASHSPMHDFVTDDDNDGVSSVTDDAIVAPTPAEPEIEYLVGDVFPESSPIDKTHRGNPPTAEDDDNGDEDDDTDSTPPSDPADLPGFDDLEDAAAKSDGDSSFMVDDEDALPSPRKLISQRSLRSTPNVVVKRLSPTSDRSMDKSVKRRKQQHQEHNEAILISSDDGPGSTSKKQKLKHTLFTSSGGVETASRDEIESWNYTQLTVRNERRSLMVKILHDLESSTKSSLMSSLRSLMMNPNDLKLLVQETFAKVEQENSGLTFGDGDAPQPTDRQFAKLYCCWNRCSPDPWYQDFVTIAWNDRDITGWAQCMVKILPHVERMDRAAKIETLEDSSDEEASLGPSSGRKRKRPIAKNESATATRQLAKIRLDRYQKQTAESSNLSQMVAGSDESRENIIINVLKAAEDEPIFLHPKFARRFKAHQVDGVRFMWREISASDQGCLLAHTMGLGKTAQSIALLVTIAEAARDSKTRKQVSKDLQRLKALILLPPSVLQNWIREIRAWSPTPNYFDIYNVDSTISNKHFRMNQLQQWDSSGGILLIGYNMFQSLARGHKTDLLVDGDLAKTSKKVATDNALTSEQSNKVVKILLESPNIVIADEAHIIKNEASGISKMVHRIRTQKRIALTGSPMSNNTNEIYALISWIAPNYLGTAAEFRASFAEPIEQGTYKESSSYEKRRSLKKLAVLNKQIEPKVDRADVTALRGSLKSKTEFVLTVPLTELQAKIYRMYVDNANTSITSNDDKVSQVRLFGWLAVLVLLCNHPKIFATKLTEKKTPKKTLIGPESVTSLSSIDTDPSCTSKDGETGIDVPGDEHVSALGITDDMVRTMIDAMPAEQPIGLSSRMQITRQILELSLNAGDKVLVFSQSLPTLDYLSELLNELGMRWATIHGQVPMVKRDNILQGFRAGKFDVLLISTRAGGLGLNIQDANRVIILDYGFNPTWEEQAVGRAYRLGQMKSVFVYRFVAAGSFERKLYNIGLFKTSLASRVVDKKNPARHAERKAKEWLFYPEEVDQEDIATESGKDPHVLDKIIASHSLDHDTFIRGIKTMETLQMDAMDEPLNEEEQKEVEEEIALQQRRTYLRAPTFSTTQIPSTQGLSTAQIPRTQVPSTTRLVDTLWPNTQRPPITPYESPRPFATQVPMTNQYGSEVLQGPGMVQNNRMRLHLVTAPHGGGPNRPVTFTPTKTPESFATDKSSMN